MTPRKQDGAWRSSSRWRLSTCFDNSPLECSKRQSYELHRAALLRIRSKYVHLVLVDDRNVPRSWKRRYISRGISWLKRFPHARLSVETAKFAAVLITNDATEDVEQMPIRSGAVVGPFWNLTRIIGRRDGLNELPRDGCVGDVDGAGQDVAIAFYNRKQLLAANDEDLPIYERRRLARSWSDGIAALNQWGPYLREDVVHEAVLDMG